MKSRNPTIARIDKLVRTTRCLFEIFECEGNWPDRVGECRSDIKAWLRLPYLIYVSINLNNDRHQGAFTISCVTSYIEVCGLIMKFMYCNKQQKILLDTAECHFQNPATQLIPIYTISSYHKSSTTKKISIHNKMGEAGPWRHTFISIFIPDIPVINGRQTILRATPVEAEVWVKSIIRTPFLLHFFLLRTRI